MKFYLKSLIKDLPSAITSIEINGITKEVISQFCIIDKLDRLNDKIDDFTNSAKWIR